MLSLNLRSVKLKTWARFISVNKSLHERITVQAANSNDVGDEFVTVPAGPNAGLKIKTSVNNRNPRNLEMLNLARRDTGWGAGPTYKKRMMNVTQRDKNDDYGVKNELRNLPHQHGYHSINITRFVIDNHDCILTFSIAHMEIWLLNVFTTRVKLYWNLQRKKMGSPPKYLPNRMQLLTMLLGVLLESKCKWPV